MCCYIYTQPRLSQPSEFHSYKVQNAQVYRKTTFLELILKEFLFGVYAILFD